MSEISSEKQKRSDSNMIVLLQAVLAAMFIAARPLANQFAPYTAMNAYCGLFSLLFIAAAGLCALRMKALVVSRGMLIMTGVWLAIYILGTIRSPYIGAAIPLATDAALYIAVLIAGCVAGRLEPAMRGIFIRLLIATVVVQACAAIWQIHVDLPRLRAQVESGELPLIDALNSKIGLERLYGDNAFGTFGNPNSLAAYLLLGFFLLLGHAAASAKKYTSPLHFFLGGLMLWAMYWTGSKGGEVALLIGIWLFVVQRLNVSRPRPLLNALSIAGLSGLVLLLVLGFFEIVPSKYFGLSMQVRFEYWKSALSMFMRNPLLGVGLGGYGEWYSTFKTPMGWESRDPHNELVCMLAEFGIVGPLLYCAIWWTIFRESRIPLAPENPTASEFQRDTRGEVVVIVCGAMAMLLAIFNFDVFNSSDLINVITGNDKSAHAITGAAQTLLLPLIFALTAFFLSRRHEKTAEDNDALNHGFRAAAGAILLHTLVDFDFKSQAVMCGLFLLGGAFCGSGKAANLEYKPRSTTFVGWALVALAMLLIPTAVYIPFVSGSARERAEAEETQFKVLYGHPERLSPGETLDQHRGEILTERLRALDAAPFDSEAHVELALALAKYDFRAGAFPLSDEILGHLKNAEKLRPLAVNPKVLIGCLYFKRGINLLKSNQQTGANEYFNQAREQFGEALKCYPLHPGLALMEGDALLMMGEKTKASSKYADAFRIDIAINDPNVILAAIFNDPRPGVFARHGADESVLAEINKHVSTSGFIVRNLVAYTYLLRELESRSGSSAERKAEILLQKARVIHEARTLYSTLNGLQDRAHAAMLLAVCLDQFGTSEEAAAAKKTAIDLQEESIKQNTPGTAPYVFKLLLQKQSSK